MEHLEHFNLSKDPFCNELDLSFFHESAEQLDTQRRMARSIRQAKGLTVMTGPHGSGKSFLARRLFEELDEESFEAVLLVMLPGATDARTVLGRLALELGVESPGDDRSSILAHLYQQLVSVREAGRKFVLIIDDAQILGSEAMSEIGGLLSMEHEGRRLLSLLLVGSAELDSCLDGAASLVQRVDVRVRLEPLDLADTKAYIDHRIARVGGTLGVFSPPALDALFKSSRGRPRLINTLADNALFEAYLRGGVEVGAPDVERAAADLSRPPESESEGSPVEDALAAFSVEDDGSVAVAQERAPSMPSLASATPIGKLELIDEASPLFMNGPEGEASLDLADDDLLSLPIGEQDGSSLEPEVPAERTMDLEVEWIPDAEGEALDREPVLAAEGDPAAGEELFLDLLED